MDIGSPYERIVTEEYPRFSHWQPEMTLASLEVPPVDHFFSKDRGISPSGLVFEVGDSNHPKFDLHDLNSRRLDLQNSQSLLLGSDSLDSTLDPTRPPSPEGRSTWVTSPPPNCHYKNC